MVAMAVAMTKVSPCICLVVDAWLSSDTLVVAMGRNLHRPLSMRPGLYHSMVVSKTQAFKRMLGRSCIILP